MQWVPKVPLLLESLGFQGFRFWGFQVLRVRVLGPFITEAARFTCELPGIKGGCLQGSEGLYSVDAQ